MNDQTHKKRHRQLTIVSQLRHDALSSQELARRLARRQVNACPKTIQRDIRAMQRDVNAPIDYDETEHGYRLIDPSWTYPTHGLEGDQLFASLFTFRLSQPVLPAAIHDLAETATRVQLAAWEPDELPDQLLTTLIQATSSKILPPDDQFAAILQAWRASTSIRLTYSTARQTEAERRIEPHALFLHEGAWYIRGYCHLRQRFLSFAIHRCQQVTPLPDAFCRSHQAIAALQGGNPFDYPEIANVVLSCSPAKAPVIAERDWFPGQTIDTHADGSLTLRYPSVPEPLLIRWVLSYAGHLTVQAPESIRTHLHDTAEQLRANHSKDAIFPQANNPSKDNS